MDILCQDKNGVRTLSINRPERLNVLDTQLFLALEEELDRAAKDPDVRCIVLRGEGKCFCAGHDMTVFGRPDQSERVNASVVSKLAAMPMPTIAAIHGHCYTGGLELALGCDMMLVSENVRIGDTHAKFGLNSAWGLSARLPRRVGYPRALEMTSTCRIYSGREAAEIGLALYCWEDEGFFEKVQQFGEQIGRNSPYAVRRTKSLLKASEDIAAALEREWMIGGPYGFSSPDSEERIKAFLNKGKK